MIPSFIVIIILSISSKKYKINHVLTLPEWTGSQAEPEYMKIIRKAVLEGKLRKLWRFDKGEYAFVAPKTAMAIKEQGGAAK